MKILLVDDDTYYSDSLREVLPHDIEVSYTAEYAKDLINENKYDLILLDWVLPFDGARGFLNSLKDSKNSDTKVWVVTGLRSIKNSLPDGVEYKFKLDTEWLNALKNDSIIKETIQKAS